MSDWVFSQRGSEFVARYETDEANVRALDEKMKQFNRGRDFVLQLLFGVIAIAVLAWTSVRFPVIMGAHHWIGAFVLTVFPLIDAFAPLPAHRKQRFIRIPFVVLMSFLKGR